jgi:hydrogenase maturation factor
VTCSSYRPYSTLSEGTLLLTVKPEKALAVKTSLVVKKA